MKVSKHLVFVPESTQIRQCNMAWQDSVVLLIVVCVCVCVTVLFQPEGPQCEVDPWLWLGFTINREWKQPQCSVSFLSLCMQMQPITGLAGSAIRPL